MVNRWPIGITLFSLHLLFIHFIFELSHVSLSVALDSFLHHLFLRQSSITVHVRRSTLLLFMISWCTVSWSGRLRSKGTSFKHQVYQGVARKSQVEVCERRGKSFIKYFKEPIIKMLPRNTPYTIPQLVSAPLNPIPIAEHFRRSHPPCEHSCGQHI